MIVALMIVPVMIVIVTKMPPKPRSRLSSASAGAATDSDAAIDIVDIKETKIFEFIWTPQPRNPRGCGR